MTIEHFEINSRLSQAIVHNGTVYLAGQTPKDRSQDASGQTQEVLEKIDALLAKCGTNRRNLLAVQIYLKDIESDFSAMNLVWEKWIGEDVPPTRATVQALLAAPEILVEIVCTAAVP